jgi:hypothetical protein
MTHDPALPDLAAGIKPSVLIIDDSDNQVSELKKRLHQDGFEPRHVKGADEARAEMANRIFDILLVDVSLLGERDTSGLKLGREAVTLCPEAVRLCISREAIVNTEPMDILRALNLEGGPEKMGRLFEAFGEKTKPGEVLSLIHYVRRHVCCTNTAAVHSNAEVAGELDDVLARRALGDSPQPVKEVRRQFIEIVRRLAYRPNMPEPTAIRIEPVGLGRSRTLVFAMEVQYGQLDYSSRSIIKIGGNELVAQERDSYGKYVPLFVNHGTYPFLENYAASRDLAGIAYGHLGILESGRLPPTFAEAYWRMEGRVIDESLDRIFQLLVPQRGNDPVTPESIRTAYERRFRFLTKKDVLRQRLEKALARLGQGKGTADAMALTFPDRPFNELVGALKSLDGDGVAFASYSQAVVHGDLHFHNVVLADKDLRYPFLIDFAHIGPQHKLLDYIVAEVSVRVQLCQGLAEEAAKRHDGDAFIWDFMRLEAVLAAEAVGRTAAPRFKEPRFDKIAKTIVAIRHKAAARAGKESHANYFAGLGLTALSILGLPGDDESSKLIRSWVAVAATVQLDLVNTAAPQLTLWGAASADQSEDDKINASVVDARTRLDTEFEEKLAMLDHHAAVSDALLQSVALTLAQLQEALPHTIKTLEEIVEKSLKAKPDAPKAKILAKIGVGFLALQVEKEIKLTASADPLLKELSRLIGKMGFPPK